MQGARKTLHFRAVGLISERRQQGLRALEFACDRIADSYRRRRRRHLAFFHDVEMRVKGRDLIHGCLGQSHLGAERAQMARRDAAVTILDEMKVLDQEIGAARTGAEQLTHFAKRLDVELTPLGKRTRTLPRPHVTGRTIGAAPVVSALVLHVSSRSVAHVTVNRVAGASLYTGNGRIPSAAAVSSASAAQRVFERPA